MLRASLRFLRQLPRLLQRTARHSHPRVLVASPWLSRHQTYRAFSAQTSYMARPDPLGPTAFGMTFLAIYALSEYFPSRSSPNGLMNDSLEIVKGNEEVHRRLGSKLVGRGDLFKESITKVEHLELDDKDGRPCIRIRYNLFGPRGYASVFAEAAKDSKKGEFNFIYVQFDDNHEVLTIIDPTDNVESSDFSETVSEVLSPLRERLDIGNISAESLTSRRTRAVKTSVTKWREERGS